MRVGTAANEVPTNGMLGEMAFQDPNAVMIEGGLIGGKAIENLVDQQALAAARFGDPYSAIPTLDLSFVGGLQAAVARERFTRAQVLAGFSNIITFTRASGAGRFNAAGQYEWLAADQPRIDYDPVTGEAKGLLIEEQRTNKLWPSQTFGGDHWVRLGDCAVTDNYSQSPDGGANAARVQMTVAGSGSLRWGGLLLGADIAHTFSLWMRGTEGQQVRLAIWDSGLGRRNGPVITLGTSFKRYSFTHSPVNGRSCQWTFLLPVSESVDVEIWQGQVEAGTFATSDIPTTTAQVTRAADVASVDVLSPWFNASEGTLFVEAVAYGVTGRIAAFSDGTANNRIEQYFNSGKVTAFMVANGDFALTGANDVVTPAKSAKVATAFSSAGLASSVNGGAVLTDGTIPTIPALTRAYIGADPIGGRQLNGHIRSIRYFPRRLSDAELQAITA